MSTWHSRDIPVLVVSGSMDPQDPSVQEAGVTAVVGKPFAPAELLRAIDQLLAHPARPR
jgi:CheY-like chemotaxis protein